ncbi:MAG: S26 family signal peptidase [Planctomycetota bacterium]
MLGEHLNVKCDDCQFLFPIDGNLVPASNFAVCPLCGYPKNNFSKQAAKASKLVDLEEISHSGNRQLIKRWTAVGFASNNQTSDKKFLVKRIVGLPGENIRISSGNVIVNEELSIKPSHINLQTEQLIFDSKFTFEEMNRLWESSGEEAWRLDPNNGAFYLTLDQQQEIESSFAFRPIRGYRHQQNRFATTPIQDSCSYNQNVARKLNRVSEVAVELDFANVNQSKGLLEIKLSSDSKSLTVDFTNRKFWIETRPPVGFPRDSNRSLRLRFDNYDGLLKVMAYGKTLQKLNAPRRSADFAQICLSSQYGSIQISRIRILRDIYYFNLNQADESIQLGEGEYFVLGDNPPISIDSRTFGPIHHSQVFGTVQTGNPK